MRDGELRPGRPSPARACAVLAVGLVAGAVAGAAAADLGAGWVPLASAGALLGASVAGVDLLGHRLDVGVAVTGLAAGVVAGLEGLLLGWVALRGDGERTDSLLGTSVLAVVVGLVCAGLAGLLLGEDAPDATADEDLPPGVRRAR